MRPPTVRPIRPDARANAYHQVGVVDRRRSARVARAMQRHPRVDDAASFLKVPRSTLYSWLRRWEMEDAFDRDAGL